MADHLTPPDATIAIAATFVIEPLLPGLQYSLREAGVALDVRFAPYHQVFQELLSSTSLLATNAGGIDVVLVRLEDFVRDVHNIQEARTLLRRIAKELSEAIGQHARRVKAPTVLAVLPPSPSATTALIAELEAASADLTTHARTLPGIALLSSDEIDRVSTTERYDSLSNELAHVPFTDEYYAALALAITRKVHAIRVPALKVLVLDCDETLWRGVVGEDGVDGITIPPALAKVQQFACDAQSKGVLVCLVSKNTERDVLEVFERRSDMVLKLEHIVAHRINWEPKPRNVASLAQILNLGLDSFAFLDDNPVECALMRAELPQVVTLQVPADDEVESFLSNLWIFDKVNVTAEDVRRTTMYRENAARRESEEASTDIAEFMASLNVVIDIAPPEDTEWPRVAQLTQRTNQFNFTTIRRNESGMRGLLDSGNIALRVKVRDRFGDYGLVGVVIANPSAQSLVVDTFLLSCRVLGRGVEHAILRRLGEIAHERNLQYVDLPYLQTSKNEPARAFAESVAVDFQTHEHDHILYRIPVDYARIIAHRPGHDPAAVIEARKSEETKGSGSSVALNPSTFGKGRSERYSSIARTLLSGRDVLRAVRGCRTSVRTLSSEPEKPATDFERKLLALWQELLGIDGLGVEDDYFALGGTSLVAARLFAEIDRRFGVRLPLTTILGSPTVRALSRHLEWWPAERSDSLIELRRGGLRNLFLVHDGFGETLLYLNLASRMPSDLTVLGIEPRRTAGVPLAHTCIEDMAASYIEEIRKRQPFGPYLLGGMCAGGVIAYEMASQLSRAGERIELLALFDAATPQAPKIPARMTKRRLARLSQLVTSSRNARRSTFSSVYSVASAVVQKLVNTLAWETTHRVRRWSVRIRFHLLQKLLARQQPWPRYMPELSVQQIYESAEPLYVPGPFSGATALLLRARAGEDNDIPYRQLYADETLGWSSIVDDLTVVDVDGGHSSMLQEPFVESLAAALMPHVIHQPQQTYVRPVEAASV